MDTIKPSRAAQGRLMRSKGFSLIELLIVVAIILIIAAIAIPNLLQARIAANESSAAAGLHVLQTAEVTYDTAYPTVGFADGMAQLGGAVPCTPAATAACLVDNVLATAIPGSVGKSGYVFQATGNKSGGSTSNTGYVVAAAPVAFPSTGNRDFCSTSDVTLRAQMGSAGDLPVTTEAACVAFPVAP
jgi:prepilin-type N-terminal cleavage/methylation domain-containing protein